MTLSSSPDRGGRRLSIELVELISEALVLFEAGEQLAADLPSFNVGQELLQKKFGVAQIAMGQQGNQLLWLAQKGQCTLGERKLLIDSANGNNRRLSVSVYGTTPEAFDVLQELWVQLVDCERGLRPAQVAEGTSAREPIGRVVAAGRPIAVTTAIVKLPFRVNQLFPQADFLREEVRGQLDDGYKLSRAPMMRFSLEVRIDWGLTQRNVNSVITFEPRSGDDLDSKVFFTRSPLPSDKHLKVVERFAEKFKPTT